MKLSLVRLIFSCALLLLPPITNADPLKAWGYVGWWLPNGWRTVPLEAFERLLFFDMKIKPDGSIGERNGWPERWNELSQTAKISGTPIDVTLTLMDSPSFKSLFSSKSATQKLLDETAQLAAQPEVSGIHLDVEIYDALDTFSLQGFRDFVKSLKERLARLEDSKSLSIFLPLGGISPLYDTATLQQVDRIVMQGYDAHWLESKFAGPVAPLDGPSALTWKKAVKLGRGLGIPPQKMLMSFPLYGYEWRVKSPALQGATIGRGISTAFAPMPVTLAPEFQVSVQSRVAEHGATYHPISVSSSYQFKTKSGQHIEGWFDDWWTLSRKSDFLEEANIGGIAFFLLGYDDGELLNYFFQRQQKKFKAPPAFDATPR
jgi:spore germination protein YaaH